MRRAFPGAESVDVPEDWRDRWREFHHGLVVGRFWVGPPWEKPTGDVTPVVIDPGRAFGTGAHATTRLCLELVQAAPRGSLVDVGCGSGVLAIAAAKLGFEPVIALDVDPAAVEATGADARRNGVGLDVRLADALESLPDADVSVANLTREALPWLPLRSPLAITSGYLVGEEISLPAYERVERRIRDGWAADLLRRRQS